MLASIASMSLGEKSLSLPFSSAATILNRHVLQQVLQFPLVTRHIVNTTSQLPITTVKSSARVVRTGSLILSTGGKIQLKYDTACFAPFTNSTRKRTNTGISILYSACVCKYFLSPIAIHNAGTRTYTHNSTAHLFANAHGLLPAIDASLSRNHGFTLLLDATPNLLYFYPALLVSTGLPLPPLSSCFSPSPFRSPAAIAISDPHPSGTTATAAAIPRAFVVVVALVDAGPAVGRHAFSCY